MKSSNFFVSNAKNLSFRERVQELGWGDQTRNASGSVVIVAATFIGKYSLLKFSNKPHLTSELKVSSAELFHS